MIRRFLAKWGVYKCLDCEYVFDSWKWPTRCPGCGGKNFQEWSR